MFGPTGLKEEEKKKCWKRFGHSFPDLCVFTQLWLVGSEFLKKGVKVSP